MQVSVAAGGAETGGLAFEEDLGVRLAHESHRSESDGTAEDGQEPEGPAPAQRPGCEASNDWPEDLPRIKKRISMVCAKNPRGKGKGRKGCQIAPLQVRLKAQG